MDELLELRGIVEAPPDAVAAILLDARPGGRSPLAVPGTADPDGGDVFRVRQNGSTLTWAVDRDALTVTVTSEWWYQGVTAIAPDERGSAVTHRIFNVAPGQAWAVRFFSRGALTAAPAGFAAQLCALGTDLGCRAYPVD